MSGSNAITATQPLNYQKPLYWGSDASLHDPNGDIVCTLKEPDCLSQGEMANNAPQSPNNSFYLPPSVLSDKPQLSPWAASLPIAGFFAGWFGVALIEHTSNHTNAQLIDTHLSTLLEQLAALQDQKKELDADVQKRGFSGHYDAYKKLIAQYKLTLESLLTEFNRLPSSHTQRGQASRQAFIERLRPMLMNTVREMMSSYAYAIRSASENKMPLHVNTLLNEAAQLLQTTLRHNPPLAGQALEALGENLLKWDMVNEGKRTLTQAETIYDKLYKQSDSTLKAAGRDGLIRVSETWFRHGQRLLQAKDYVRAEGAFTHSLLIIHNEIPLQKKAQILSQRGISRLAQSLKDVSDHTSFSLGVEDMLEAEKIFSLILKQDNIPTALLNHAQSLSTNNRDRLASFLQDFVSRDPKFYGDFSLPNFPVLSEIYALAIKAYGQILMHDNDPGLANRFNIFITSLGDHTMGQIIRSNQPVNWQELEREVRAEARWAERRFQIEDFLKEIGVHHLDDGTAASSYVETREIIRALEINSDALKKNYPNLLQDELKVNILKIASEPLSPIQRQEMLYRVLSIHLRDAEESSTRTLPERRSLVSNQTAKAIGTARESRENRLDEAIRAPRAIEEAVERHDVVEKIKKEISH